MKKRIQKRMLAWMLTFAMVLSMIPVTAFAEEDLQSTECTHSHDETCGYVEAVDEIPCDQECTDTDEDGLIDHVEECAYTPAVEGQPCTHIHDEICGGVIVEQPEEEIEEESMAEDTRTLAEDLLQTLLEQYFEGVDTGEIYQVILEMNTDTRLGMIDAYEELLAALTEEDEHNESLWELLGEIYCGISDAAENEQTQLPVFYQTNVMALEGSDSIELKRISGSGNAFVYHSFQEITGFTAGETYAFLDSFYGAEDAVSALGSGAILKATAATNGSSKYIKRKYGDAAAVKVYVDVITRGRDFDSCIIGGLYEVPNSGKPTEYRYFCGYGGAQNCGPYYAYNYVKESLTYDKVSASLKNIEKQGSENPEDYTVMITYDGNQCKTLDAGSYTVQIPDPASDQVIIVVSDSEGNSITAKFQCPLAVRYDGNSENASNVPSVQAAWQGESSKISLQKPTRTGYSFVNWKDAETATAYSAGKSFTPAKSLNLLAQWKDNQAPNVGYTPTQVMTGDSDSAVKDAVQAALTVTDNEPVSECTVTVTLQSGFTKTPGNKDVTVEVTDKAGNTTTKTCSVYVSSYVDISTPVFTASTKNLTSTLNNPGTDAVTESGFVWGVMNSPSLTVNNGKAKTTTTASKAGDIISVTADNFQKGVTYYARAYITSGSVTYYSEEITIGLGLPAYGTFTITNNNNNTFTVTRSGGSEGAQTVYFRTVNGSAVGGTHFTHKNDTLTFNEGVTSQTITITENTANTAYSGKPATAYINADRTYSVEIYRVTGGGALGSTTSATRTMKNGSGYTVDRTIYTAESSWSHNVDINNSYDNRWVADHSGSGDGNLYWRNDRGYNQTFDYDNFNTSASINGRYSDPDYIKATAQAYLYRYDMRAHEVVDGWEHAWMGTREPNNAHSYTKCDSTYTGAPISLDDSKAGHAVWTAVFQIAEGYSVTKHFPATATDGGEDKGSLGYTVKGYNNDGSVVSVGGTAYAKIPIADTVYNFFAATGANYDEWYVESFTDYTKIYDTVEPQLVAVAPMAGGLYKVGDSFTVSLIFDEIVDSQNSGNLSSVTLNTTWGLAVYAGGVDTNVLYFTGTVASNASSTLSVNGFTNTDFIKDMCDSVMSTPTESSTGSSTASVDTSVPNFTVTAKGITNGTGTAAITINADKTKTTGMRYAWSDSETAPANGWVELTAAELTSSKSSSGLSLSIRKEPGSGISNGKWYLHVIGTYDTTGATSYKCTCVDFGTVETPVNGGTKPTLTVTADNTNWAANRIITIQAAGAEELKYRMSGSTDWKTLATSATGVTVTDNGYYTFLLTAGETTITKTVQVAKIDKVNPTASVGNPTSATLESPKAGVYTKLTLPITYTDAQSGVKTVKYAWTNSQTTPSSWTTLSQSETTVTYTGTESVPATKYLHLQVTDNVGHTGTTCSSAYTVISQEAVNSHAPTITIKGAPASWTNDMATLTWELENYSEKNYEVILPDGRKARTGAAKGEVWAMQNGTYTVKVRDLDYCGENIASVVVDKLDFTAPSVDVGGVSANWENSAQTLTLTATDTASGVGEIWYKIVTTDRVIPETGLTQLDTGNNKITINQDGEWYLYYKVYDQTGDMETGREANKTEGFAGPIRVDTVKPVIGTLSYSYEPKNLWDWLIGKESLIITVPVTEEGSGADRVTYTVTPEGGSGQNRTASIQNGSAEITVSADFKGTIVMNCTDKAGNASSSVTVGTSGKGLIIENDAPEITFGTYTAASGITVTVKDDKDNAISAGLASVTYQIGDGSETTVQQNFTTSKKTEVNFTIGAEKIPTGGVEIIVKATDNAGNYTEQSVTIAKYNVAYDYEENGGTSATKTSDVILSGDMIDLTPTAKKEGWEFVGWNTDKNATKGLTSLTMQNGDITLYAIYSKVLTLTCYSGSAGENQTNTVTIYNKATEGQLTVPAAKAWSVSNERYEFYRYATSPDIFEGTMYDGNSTIVLSKNTSLYAVYRKTITVTYDANGGTGSVNAQNVFKQANMSASDTVTYKEASVTLQDGTDLSRIGHTFNGWIKGSSTGTAIEAGTSVTLTADTTYYASWTPNVYSVALDLNGGSGGTALTDYTYGIGAALPTDWTKTGYTFGGWYDNESLDGTAVETISATSIGTKNYWAKWTLNAPTVTLSADKDSVTYDPGNNVIILTAKPTHAAASESSSSNITYTYKWYRDGQELRDTDSTVRSLTLVDVNQSGTYTVEVTAKDGEGRTSEVGNSNEVTVNIAKAPITFTVSENTHSYDTNAKTASVEQTAGQTPRIDADGYEVSYEQNGNKVDAPTDAGTYAVIVNLKDNNFSHFGQSDSVTKQKVGELIIEKKQVTAVWTNLTAEYNGTAQAPRCTTLVGLMEADAGDVFADFTGEQRLTNAGTKRLTAVLAGTRADNYQLTNAEVNFTVQKAPVTFNVTDNFVLADNHSHTATVSASVNGVSLDAVDCNGNPVYEITYRDVRGETVEEPTDAGTYGIFAELTDANYRHSGTAEAAARQIGVLTIYRNQTQTPKTYTVKYASGAEGASEVTGDLPAEQNGLSAGTLIYLPEKGTFSRTGYAFTGWLLNGKLYQPGEAFTMSAKNVTITACWKESTYRISGVVDQEGNPLHHAAVTLKRGSEIIGETITDGEGNYSFEGVMPGLYNLVTAYDGITTTVKVLIEDADAVENMTLPAGRTNSILEVMAGAPAVIVGNLEKLFQIAEESDPPVYPEMYTDNDKDVVETGGTVEIRLTVEKVAEPDQTGAELLKEAMQKLPEAFNYQTELYLDLVLQKTVYPAAVSGSGSAVTETLSDSQVILESVISLPSNLQNRRFYKVYRIHQNAPGDIVLEELTAQPNAEGEYFELNPENTELTIRARKYSVYTVAASDYVAPQPANSESSEGTGEHSVTGLPEETIQLPEEEKKAKNSQMNEKPLDEEKKWAEASDAETEKPEVIPEDALTEEAPVEEMITNETIGKPFVLLNVLLTLLSLVMAALMMMSRQEKKRKIAGATVAVVSLLILLLTLGFDGVRLADLCTILFAVLVAAQVVLGLTGINREDKKEEV